MPVWHSSSARISQDCSRIIPVNSWGKSLREAAKKVCLDQVLGVGGTWELWEEGEFAIHYRRRLSLEEMRLLHAVNAMCPVFTHGAALKPQPNTP